LTGSRQAYMLAASRQQSCVEKDVSECVLSGCGIRGM